MPTRFVVYLDGSRISDKAHTTWGDAFDELWAYDAGERAVIGDPNDKWGPEEWRFTGHYSIKTETHS